MGRFVTTNSPGGNTCVLGNSTATVCGSHIGDGSKICNVGACSSSGIGCVWQPIEVCCCWNNQVTGYKTFLYNFSCWSMIKFETHGMARCNYDSHLKVVADSTNCDLSTGPNTSQYLIRYQFHCGFTCVYTTDVVCITTNCNATGEGSNKASVIFCIYPIVTGCTANPSLLGGRFETNGHAAHENSCSIGSWNPACHSAPGNICYPLCCVANCVGRNFNRLRVANSCCFWSACQGGTGAVSGAHYGLWGIPRQTLALVPPG